jgi:hypothetical protein
MIREGTLNPAVWALAFAMAFEVNLDPMLFQRKVNGLDLPELVESQQQAIVIVELIHARNGTAAPQPLQLQPLNSQKNLL